MKTKISTKDVAISKTLKSFSPEEVFAAGGASAFGKKMGKSNESIVAALKELPTADPFSDEEWDALMAQLKKDK